MRFVTATVSVVLSTSRCLTSGVNLRPRRTEGDLRCLRNCRPRRKTSWVRLPTRRYSYVRKSTGTSTHRTPTTYHHGWKVSPVGPIPCLQVRPFRPKSLRVVSSTSTGLRYSFLLSFLNHPSLPRRPSRSVTNRSSGRGEL